MNVKILLVTHEAIGAEFLAVTRNTYGSLPIDTEVIAIDYKADPQSFIPRLEQLLNAYEPTDGILILTDLYGSTPSNIALTIALTLEQHHHVQVISGLNLPMLLKVMNYPELDLIHLAQKALCGGKDGIMNCSNENLIPSI